MCKFAYIYSHCLRHRGMKSDGVNLECSLDRWAFDREGYGVADTCKKFKRPYILRFH
jgi:hypothetical protein